MDSESEPALKSRSILVVDDNSSLREALAAVLGDEGYLVFQASNGNAAIDIMHQQPIALLITDLVMPEGEGIETIRHFGQEFPHIPVIAMSGMPDYLPMAKALGAAVILEKPIVYPDLLRAVRAFI